MPILRKDKFELPSVVESKFEFEDTYKSLKAETELVHPETSLINFEQTMKKMKEDFSKVFSENKEFTEFLKSVVTEKLADQKKKTNLLDI